MASVQAIDKEAEAGEQDAPEVKLAPKLNTIYFGDAYTVMEMWPNAFVDTTVTSPPYWGQREYLTADHPLKKFEMGCEDDPAKYIDDMGDLFAEVYRITKTGGTLWLNIGDKYDDKGQLLGTPWRLVWELQSRGWSLVEEVIWHKSNTIPEASDRRCSLAHEHVFHFAKGAKHYHDPYAIMQPASKAGDPDVRCRSVWSIPVASVNGRKILSDFRVDGSYFEVDSECQIHGDNPEVSAGPLFQIPAGVSIQCSCKKVDADFFAAMPTRLAERCILASTSPKGNCAECGRAYRRTVEKVRVATRPGTSCSVDPSGKSRRDPQRHVTTVKTTGWEPSCDARCKGVVRVTPVVFDPFCGSGTTPLVASSLGRDYLAIELNPESLKLARARIEKGL